MGNLVNEFNRTYRDVMDEEMERENIVRRKSQNNISVFQSIYKD